jgi:hypothetical protein
MGPEIITAIAGAIGALIGALATITAQASRSRAEREKQRGEVFERIVEEGRDFVKDVLINIRTRLSETMSTQNLSPLKKVKVGDLYLDSNLEGILGTVVNSVARLDEDLLGSKEMYDYYERRIKQAMKRVNQLLLYPEILFHQVTEPPPYQWGPFRLRDLIVAGFTFVVINVLYVIFIALFFLDFVPFLSRLLGIIGFLNSLF